MIKSRSVLVFSFLFVLLAASATAQRRVAPAHDFFPLGVGYSWTYRSDIGDTEYTVNVLSQEKQADGSIIYLLEKQAGLKIHAWFSKPSGWVHMHREAYPEQQGMDVKYEPARQYLKNPLVAGEKWFWKGSSISGQDVVESYEVVGPETVKVAAGSFRTMKVVSRISEGPSTLTKTYWYSDGVGLVKYYTEAKQFQNGWELVSYSFKKASPK